MDRRTFLGRSLAAVGALSLGRLPKAASAEAAPEALPWALPGADPVADIRAWAERGRVEQIRARVLVTADGLCAPVAPYYTLALVDSLEKRPVHDALPVFAADRGGIRYE